jgi:hypothetical protein
LDQLPLLDQPSQAGDALGGLVSAMETPVVTAVAVPIGEDVGPQMTMSLDTQVNLEPEIGPSHE